MNSNIKIAFAGDISLNGQYLEKNITFLKTVFADIRQFLDYKRVDFLIVNLESPLEGDGSENILKTPRVKANKRSFEALEYLTPDLVVLCNNHIFDCLEPGHDNTVVWLEDHGIAYSGAWKKYGNPSPFQFTIKDQDFSILPYIAEDTHPSLPEDANILINFIEPNKVVQEVKSVVDNSIVIVSLHWGVEFSHYPSPNQRKLAAQFIDAGALIVYGHHTHTIQGIESYGRGQILYSLGNFAFDDIMSTDHPVLWTKDQQHGGLSIVTIKNRKIVDVELYVVFNNELKIELTEDGKWLHKVKKRTRRLALDEQSYRRFWRRYQFVESIIKPPFRYFFGERKKPLKQLSSLRVNDLKKPFNYFKTYFTNITN